MLSVGYLNRVPDPEDGRQAKLSITAAGRALHNDIAKTLIARQEEVLRGTRSSGEIRAAAPSAETCTPHSHVELLVWIMLELGLFLMPATLPDRPLGRCA